MRVPHRSLTLVALLLLPAPTHAQSAAGPSGHWEGTITIPNREMGLAIDLARSPTGVWAGSLTIPGSTTVDVPIGDLRVEGMAVRFTASTPDTASFEGTLSADATSLSGTVTGAQGSAPFRLARNGEPDVKVPPPSSPLSKDFEGDWAGVLTVGDKALRLGLRLWAAPDGTALCTLTSVDQGAQAIPVTTVTLKGRALQLELRAVSGTYQGTLGAAGEIMGEWRQGPTGLPLNFTRAVPLK